MVLPVPLLDVLLESSTVSNSVVVILETTVISWTKQIKVALKLDLDKALKAKSEIGPLAELKVSLFFISNYTEIDIQLNYYIIYIYYMFAIIWVLECWLPDTCFRETNAVS